MIRFYIDTNILLRFYLKDNLKQYQRAEKYFQQAEQHRNELILMPFIVIELNHVLRKVYGMEKNHCTQILINLVKTKTLRVIDQEILTKTINLYGEKNIDLTDALLYVYARQDNATVLSFDKDFRKLK